ncbi:hypothetical protein E4T56_gene18612 [Termitomyces sp. T112]|nr:hypothetical protein E4T56_gene18612 [Termitomyces sp. T112]
MATRTKTQTARVTCRNAQQAALGPEGPGGSRGPEGLAESGGVVNQNDDPEQRRVRTDVGYSTPPGCNTNDLPNVGLYQNRNMSGDADRMSSESNDVASVTNNEDREQLIAEARRAVEVSRANTARVKHRLEILEGQASAAKKTDDTSQKEMRDKGKGPDPREWGATQLSNGEMDPDEQQVRFELAKAEENVHEPNRNKKAKAPMNPNSSESEGASDSDSDTKGMSKHQLKKEIKALKHLAKMKNDTHHVKRERRSATPMSNNMKELITKSTEGQSKPGKKLVRTSEQFKEHTYLGKAFRDISEEPDPDDSDDNESKLSSNDDDESSANNDPGTSDEESGMELMPKKKTESKKKGTKMRKTKTHDGYESERATQVKPTAPEKYDGTPDAVRFYQFINQSVRYLERGRVPQWDHIAEIANYLKGKAYKFFLTNVSMEME